MDRQDYEIGWICALPLEFTAAIAFLEERHPPLQQDASDTNAYEFGRMGSYNVIIACLPFGEYGVTSAATAAAHMHRSFPFLTAGLIVGIAGGVPLPHDIRLGDVVVSKPVPGFGGVLQYDFGKTIQEGQFVQTGVLNKPPKIFLAALAKLKSEHQLKQNNDIDEIITNSLKDGTIPQGFARPPNSSDRLFQAHYDHPPESTSCDQCDPRMVVERAPRPRDQPCIHIHYGLIASGNQVIKHGITRDLLAREKDVLAFEMEAAGVVDELPSLVIRGICDYSDSHKNKAWQPYAALTAAVFAKQLLLQLPLRAGSKNNRTQRVNLNLPTAEGAAFGSYADQHEPECLEGTRVDLLSTITRWVDNPQKEAGIFWLVGGAGTGKSTISRTIARSLEKKCQLGASFFFKRGEADRGSAALFFSTIANQLATHLYCVASSIQEAIESNPRITKKALKEQFDKLIWQPLSKIKPADSGYNARSVLLIDALDECEGIDDVKVIIGLIEQLQSIKAVDIRVFLTSRPDFPILFAFNKLPEGTHQRIILHEVPRVEDDILLFLKYELSKIRDEHSLPEDWPGDQITKKLAEMASPLFIYAATMCRFLGDISWNPEQRIEEVLNYQEEQVSQLHSTYLPILKKLVLGQDDAKSRKMIEEFRQIVGTIVNLFSPLSILSLAGLLSVSKNEISCRLRLLYSVLDVPDNHFKPVRIFHLSFRDFLISRSLRNENPFWIDERETHRMIAGKCIELMSGSAGLKKNICNLPSPGTLRSDIDKEIVERHLSPELRYACRYWIHHLIRSGYNIANDSQTYMFFQEHLLHWLEATSLLDIITEAFNALNSLTPIIDAEKDESISKFIYDIKRFMLQNQEVLQKAPLQVYYSALVFAPRKCTIRKIFDPERMITWVKRLPLAQEEWDAQLQTLEGHGKPVGALAFSPNGKILASSSVDGTVRLWDATSGVPLYILEQYNDEFNAIEFSPDGKLLASGSRRRIRLWNVGSGVLLKKLERYHSFGRTIIFSPNGKVLVGNIKFGTIGVWDTALWVLLKELRHAGPIDVIAFSPDGKFLAAGFAFGIVTLWNTDSWEPIKTLGCGFGQFGGIAFSPDSKILALSLYGGWIKHWDTTSWTRLQRLDKVDDDDCAIVFSPDGKILASYSQDGKVKLWDAAERGLLQQMLPQHNIQINAIAFSRDGKVLASSSHGGTIKLWDVNSLISLQTPNARGYPVDAIALSPNGTMMAWSSRGDINVWDDISREPHILEGGCSLTGCIAFSPDGKLLALGSNRGNISVWDTTSWLELQTFDQNFEVEITAIAFSPDSKILASGSTDITLRLWDIASSVLLHTLKNYSLTSSIVFSPDGKLLASSSEDAIGCWDVVSGKLLQFFITKEVVQRLAFSRDGRCVKTQNRSYSYQSGRFRQVSDDAEEDKYISIKGEWLVRGKERLIWLPHSRRATCSAVFNNEIAIGHASGAFSVLELAFDGSPHL